MTNRASWLQRVLIALGAIMPAQVDALEDIRPGRVQVRGTLSAPATLRAPVSGKPCLAYVYRSTVAGSGRSSTGARMRPLRAASVYAPDLVLELRDGTLALQAPRSDEFDTEAHAALLAADLPGFRARERLLEPGAPVLVTGRARTRSPQDLVLEVSTIIPAPDA